MRQAVGWLLTGSLATAILANAADAVSDRALDHVGLVSLAWAVFRVGERRAAGPWTAGVAAVALGGGLAILQMLHPDVRYMPWLLIAPANLALAWVFAVGLLPGRQPVLLRLVLLMGLRPADDPRFRRFICGQCLLWAALAVATAGVACAGLLGVAAQPWLSELLATLVFVQVVWFALSHHYAALRYGRPETWWETARALARADIWSRLRTQ